MSALLVLGLVLAQAALAPLVFGRGAVGRIARAIAPWAAIPVLAVAAVAPDASPVATGWLLIDSRFGMDAVGRVFLLAAAAVWSAAGVFARGYMGPEREREFLFFFLLTMSANLALPVASDAIAFYVAFAAMTFAGYGLIVFARDDCALRAGRVYLVLAVVGEVALLVGLLLAVSAAGSTDLAAIPRAVGESGDVALITVCFLVGAGIKAGAVPLHVWLPLAHPVAPTPASAVLSGAMINAGLLAWLRLFPLGAAPLTGLGVVGIGFGTIGALVGVAVGILQRDPKTVLAYSSVSQMGVMNAVVGLGLAVPAAAPVVVAGVTLYAAHHGLAKGALFLGVGVAERRPSVAPLPRWMLLGMALPALALAGAPLTGGAVAKHELKALGYVVGPGWREWIEWFLPVSAFATTLLMAHFLLAISRVPGRGSARNTDPWLVAPWLCLTGAALLIVRFGPVRRLLTAGGGETDAAALLDALAPVLAGLVVAAGLAVWARRRRGRGDAPPTVAPGDILIPLERAAARVPWRRGHAGWGIRPGLTTRLADGWYRLYSLSDPADRLLRAELRLTSWPAAMTLLIAVTAAILFLLVWRS